ncbi:MAG: OmpA family protein, partial [Spirochaetota bacterium]|nr:OmpA family protein [Spirochaetota bacterium]
DAIKEIDEFVVTYNITAKERRLLLYKRQLYTKTKNSRGYPKSVKKINHGNNKIIISILHRNKEILGYDKATGNYILYSLLKKRFKSLDNDINFLDGINPKDLLFLSISTDGKDMLASVRTGDHTAKIMLRRYIAKDQRWSRWNTIDEMNPGSWNSYGNFTSDSRAVLFSSNIDKDNGLDIYITSREHSGKWSAPFKLAGVNTLLDEYSLFLHPDGETLYFSSNGIKGMGGFDVYAGKLKVNENKFLLSGIINIKTFNTFRNEKTPLFVDLQGKNAFLNFSVANDNFLYMSRKIILHPFAVSFFDGHVFDKKNKKPISNANVKIVKLGKKELRGAMERNTDADGSFGISLRHNSKYIVSISAKGYLYYKKYISVKKQHLVKRNFYIKKGEIKKGYSFVANNIYFDTGSAVLRRNSFAELHNIYNFLIKNPGVSIEISGYTDNVGTYEYNMELSVKRALSIATYLEKKGIKKKRLVARGFGFTKSVASNLSEAGRQKNRRVEVIVTGSVNN